jgi:hypothetical protein
VRRPRSGVRRADRPVPSPKMAMQAPAENVTAAVALIVYQKVGLAMLRRSWFNLDLIWAIALVVTGFVALLVEAEIESRVLREGALHKRST